MQKLLDLFTQIGLGQYYIDKYLGLRDILEKPEEKEMFVGEKIVQIEEGLKVYSVDEMREIMEAQIDRLDGIVNADSTKHAKAVATLDKYFDKAASAILSK